MKILKRDIYEITTSSTPIHGVMLRGRIRKFCIEHEINCLAENAEETDVTNAVRFAVLHGEEKVEVIRTYIFSILSDAHITSLMENISNPVLSKLKCNHEERYTL